MDTNRLKQFVDTFWDDSILPSITEYIRIPNKSPAFDPQWAEHGYMEDAVELMEGWAREQLAGLPRRHARGGAPARPHAADLHRGAGRRRRHRAALRPSRQAARDEGLGRGHGPVDAGAQGRQALRPRRRRRRLCDVSPASRRCWRCSEQRRAARPLRRHDRGLRGDPAATTCPTTSTIWRTASAIPRWSSASTPAAATTTGCGSRPRCAASPPARSRCAC